MFHYTPNLAESDLDSKLRSELESMQSKANSSMHLDKTQCTEFKLKDTNSSRVLATLLSYFSNTCVLWIAPELDK